MIKTKVFDKRTDKTAEFGDFVRCCHCDTVMIVDIGEDVCPVCGKCGNLMWEDESELVQEVCTKYIEMCEDYELAKETPIEQIVENIKHFMFGNEEDFSHNLEFVTWAGDGCSFIVKDSDDAEYRVCVTKE